MEAAAADTGRQEIITPTIIVNKKKVQVNIQTVFCCHWAKRFSAMAVQGQKDTDIIHKLRYAWN